MKVNWFLLIKLVLFAISVSGCAPSVYKLHSETDANNTAVITSEIDSKSEKLIIDRFGDQKRISYLTLKTIDKKNSKGNEDTRGKYNSIMDGGYMIEVLPGSHSFGVRPSGNTVSSAVTYISFDVKEGHTYFLGEVRENKNILFSDEFWWMPVVVDKTTSEMVYPDSEAQIDKTPYK